MGAYGWLECAAAVRVASGLLHALVAALRGTASLRQGGGVGVGGGSSAHFAARDKLLRQQQRQQEPSRGCPSPCTPSHNTPSR